MKKWWLLPFVFILLVVAVNARCGDYFCDADENCTSCSEDCLCNRGEHYELIDCCNDFTCKECEEGYCKDRKCDSLEGFTSIFKSSKCLEDGSLKIEVEFNELGSITLTPFDDLRVYMKQKKEDSSFTEVNGTWINPSRDGDYKYTKIADTSTFTSDEEVFILPGSYYVRVKYKMGRGDSIYEDLVVSCPGMPPEPIPVSEEPEVEDVETPEEEVVEPEEPAESVESEVPVDTRGLDWRWYLALGFVALFLVIFFLKYSIRVSKKV